jgi:acetolactate synthase-1/2/3 large subunit
MLTTADIFARTLRDAGVTRMFGLPGGEILDFMEAAREAGIEFLLTRHEATAAFMADVSGQIQRRPGVCVATLGPGAVNMTLGVANAYLDRSPLIAITATLARASARYATHQDLDLNAVYRPFTKLALTLDGHGTAAKVRHAIATSVAPRMGPVHIALPSDVARNEERDVDDGMRSVGDSFPIGPPSADAIDRIAAELGQARRPIVILGLDLDPAIHARVVRAFIDALGVPVFVTPKAKGLLPEDHPLFYGVCAGVSGDAVVLDCFRRADVLLGIGFDPVESDKLWHHTMKLVSVGPLSIAVADFRPHAEAVGDVASALAALSARGLGPFDWTAGDRTAFRDALAARLRPAARPHGLSGYELTCRLR